MVSDVVKKFVYFAEDKESTSVFSPEESYIFENHIDKMDKLMENVRL